MTSEFLPVFVENAIGENDELVQAVARRDATQEEVLAFCRNYRIAGIGDLFLTATPDALHRRLSQSGRAYAAWLAATPGSPQAPSLALPLFDAIGAADQDAAMAIARAAPRAWAHGEEYEEDFLFVELVMQRFVLGAPAAEIEALLTRWETALQGSEDARLDACRALHRGDAQAFDAGLRALLQQRTDDFEERIDAGGVPPEVEFTEALFSVEGLALLRIAEALKLPTDEDYPQVPSIARARPARAYDPDAWRKVRP